MIVCRPGFKQCWTWRFPLIFSLCWTNSNALELKWPDRHWGAIVSEPPASKTKTQYRFCHYETECYVHHLYSYNQYVNQHILSLFSSPHTKHKHSFSSNWCELWTWMSLRTGPVSQPAFPSLNKAPSYLVCVPSKVKGESSDVNIQFFLSVCVTKELIIRTRGKGQRSPGKTGKQGLQPSTRRSVSASVSWAALCWNSRRRGTDGWLGSPEKATTGGREGLSPSYHNRRPTDQATIQPSHPLRNQPASIGGVRLKHKTETKHSSTRGHKDSKRRTR